MSPSYIFFSLPWSCFAMSILTTCQAPCGGGCEQLLDSRFAAAWRHTVCKSRGGGAAVAPCGFHGLVRGKRPCRALKKQGGREEGRKGGRNGWRDRGRRLGIITSLRLRAPASRPWMLCCSPLSLSTWMVCTRIRNLLNMGRVRLVFVRGKLLWASSSRHDPLFGAIILSHGGKRLSMWNLFFVAIPGPRSGSTASR